jgi:hypothetical protein
MFKPMRRLDKQLSHEDTISLLERGQEGVLGTVSDDGYPYTVVVNYVYYNNKIYFHCAKKGHKIDNIKKNEKVSFSVYDSVEVLGNELNTKYQSLTIFGKAKVLNATNEILIKLIKKYSNWSTDKANQMIADEIGITAMVEIEIEHITGKAGK